MRIKFWGVRGSIPHSLDTHGWVRHFEKIMNDFFQSGFNCAEEISSYIKSKKPEAIGGFGVSTTCVEVSDAGRSLIIDGGSGIKAIGEAGAPIEYHILITHFHFDHIIGLPFFLPHYRKGCKIHYYSSHDETERIVKSLFQKPIFPELVSFLDKSSE
jgi:phosphoribosyl 1,2-cyclic phosphodiesterase